MTYRTLAAADYEFGKKYEVILTNYLNKTETDTYDLYPGRYNPFDLFNTTTDVELKTRKVPKDQYPTTIFNATKLDHMIKNKTYMFYFLFKDGLFKWPYNKDQYFIGNAGTFARGVDENKPHCHIPIEHLEFVTDEITSQS